MYYLLLRPSYVAGCAICVQICEACNTLDLIYTVFMRDIIVPHMQAAAATQLLLAAPDGDIATVVSEGCIDVNAMDEVL